MTEQNEAVKQTEEGKTVIRPNTETYTKTRSASGSISFHTGDLVAQALAGLSIDEVKDLAVQVMDDDTMPTKYDHLNPGQQRMNLGNRMRGAINKAVKKNEKLIADAKAKGEDVPTLGDPEASFKSLAKPYMEAANKRNAEAEAEREAKEKEREAKAAEKAAKAEAEVESGDAEDAKPARKGRKGKAA